MQGNQQTILEYDAKDPVRKQLFLLTLCANRSGSSNLNRYHWKVLHPLRLLSIRHRPQAPRLSAKHAIPHFLIAKTNSEPIPLRSAVEVRENDSGRRQFAIDVTLQLFQLPILPTEWALLLHFPLQLDSSSNFQPINTLQYAVRVSISRFLTGRTTSWQVLTR